MRTDYSNIIGKIVRDKIDRLLGNHHPRHPEMIYPINYGYIENVFAEDGAEQDIYLFGINIPVEKFEGRVIAVCRRYFILKYLRHNYETTSFF